MIPTIPIKTWSMPNVKIDSLESGKWGVSIPNIDFELPMDLEVEGNVKRVSIGPEPIELKSESRILVDPHGWYLHKKDFDIEE